MIVDKSFCASSYLMYRTMADPERCFSSKLPLNLYKPLETEKINVYNEDDLGRALKNQIKKIASMKKTAIALSGGIDSAVMAKYMPKHSKAYTFQCIVPGKEVTNEVPQAKKYAEECELQHEVIKIYWEDFVKFAPILMRHKGAPIHSIEVQIYKAALKAKEDGFETIIFGESADLNYGGLSGLMSQDWTVGEFIDRYSYVKPYYVLKKFDMITEPITQYEENGHVNTQEFCRGFFLNEAMGSYTNACQCAGIQLETPYVNTWLAAPMDIERIRAGENKYIIRALFKKLYPGFSVIPKLPMPRATDEWLESWEGPKRAEFWPNCTKNMTGDQRWMVYALERFLNLIDEEEQ